ncbi:TPA: flippase [Vibrio cholerae]|uniref:flippase n=1 Tax=Vibrio cholerae TaxID=666 RepID=UPI0004E3A78F|nr:flippase [Vibrio cholerae]KFE04144.1 polysaccharide biosynthesis family protein [Vibrio cholerae]MCX9483690.1 flippase [Vibrio cholerae]TXZ27579.1 flippase [Vibrio cholerae]BCN20146.1 putative O-antigen flippase [Vibrio cholerae]BCN21677.1 putative O-antigen flippase [Vibrio cholerae]
MLKKVKQKLTDTEEKKRLVRNILSLGILQGANYILPLLTVPYLVRVLGPEYFGLLGFATATTMYFMLVTDYGFNLSATRQISIHREDKNKVSEIFSSVMMIKAALMLVSFGLMSLLVFSFEKFSQHWEIYFITFGMVIGQVLFPVWLFQGMERMKYITYLNVGAKAFFTVCIFIFVKEQADYLLVPLLTAMGFIVSGIWSLYLVNKAFNVRFAWQTAATLKFQLVEGWHVFFSSMAISLYTISTTFILGLFTNNIVVGYFAAADKIVQAAKGLYQPLSQAIYPSIGKKIHEDKQAGLAFIHKTTWVVGTGMSVISALLFLLAEPIANLLLGQQYQQSVLLLQIMAFLPFIIVLSNMFGVQTMLNLGYKKAFSRILLAAAILGVGLSLVLVPMYEGVGSALTMLIVEVFVTVLMWVYLKKKFKNE